MKALRALREILDSLYDQANKAQKEYDWELLAELKIQINVLQGAHDTIVNWK